MRKNQITTLILVAFALSLNGCFEPKREWRCNWRVGDKAEYVFTTQFKATLQGGSKTNIHSSQSGHISLLVDSIGTRGEAYLRVRSDSLRWSSNARESLETTYMAAQVQRFSYRIRLSLHGEIEAIEGEITLPNPEPEFMLPAALFFWAWVPTTSQGVRSRSDWEILQPTLSGGGPELMKKVLCTSQKQNGVWQAELTYPMKSETLPGNTFKAKVAQPFWAVTGNANGDTTSFRLEKVNLNFKAETMVQITPDSTASPAYLNLERQLTLNRL